jgi:glycosyltransferase involved in cell wall biosynthesis
MRVLMVTHTFPRHPGDSTAPFVDSIARGVARRGHTVDIVLPHHPEFRYPSDESVRFFPYRYSPAERWSPWGFGNSLRGDSGVRRSVAPLLPAVIVAARSRIASLLAQHEYDVIHAHWVIPNGWLTAPSARRRHLPLVISLHGSDISLAERHRSLARAALRAFATAGVVTAPSDHLRRRAEAIGADPVKIETVRWGIDTTVFSPRSPDPTLRRRLLGDARNGETLFVAVGRLVECKGFEYLIDAAAQVRGIRVAIVGDGDLRAELEQRAASLGAPVTFTGPLPHDLVADALTAADAVVVPLVVDRSGRVDGFGITALEALAAGRPLLATRVGSIPELVEDGENGLLVPEKDVGALAAAMERLRDDSAIREMLASGARSTPFVRTTWDDTACAFESSYARAAERP